MLMRDGEDVGCRVRVLGGGAEFLGEGFDLIIEGVGG